MNLQRFLTDKFNKIQPAADKIDDALTAAMFGKGNIYFVDSNNGSDTYTGKSWLAAKATIDAAVGLCTDNKNDVILVAPNHAETITAASAIDFDVAGITVIGLGTPGSKPLITLGHLDATIEINADHVHIKGLHFVGGIAGGTTRAIDVKTGSDFVTIEDCMFYETAAGSEILGGITLEDKTDYFTLKNCIFRNLASGDATDAVITEADEHAFLTIEGCTFIGDWTNGILDLDAGAIVCPLIKDSTLVNLDATAGDAIDLNASSAAIMVDLRIASAKADAYPVANISASYQMNCHGCEVAKETVALIGGATATSWAS